ncbi:MAG TPA: MMPL family transporter [Ktedonobacterales bacterium]|jgi:RND superfamily putative drug exporter|nr:MMPL family transporter [Ktedonobacterales bacterium]
MFYRLGLLAVRWRFAILAAWLVVVLAALPFAPRVPEVLAPGGFGTSDMESARAITALEQGLHTRFTSVLVIFSSPTLTADDPRFRAEAAHAVAGLQTWDQVQRIVPYTVAPAQVSKDGHDAYTAVFLKTDADNAPKLLPELNRRLVQPQGLQMTVGGGPVFYADIQSVSESDLRRAELLAFPFALLALLLVFRSVIAAGLPAAVGGCSVVISLALLYLLAQVTPVSIFALNITTLFGLGLGVDYSLFMVSRFREELARGRDVQEAVGVTMSTAGRSVFFSGLAVSIGLLGLVLFPLNVLRSVGYGGIITVALSILAAVTLLPALLSLLGQRVNALPVRIPGLGHPVGERSVQAEENGFWHRLALGVMRHPVLTLVPVLAFLLLLGVPFLSVRLAAPDASILPTYVKSRSAYDTMTTKFAANSTTPIVLAVQTRGTPLGKANLEALGTYVRQLQADSRVAEVDSIVSLDPRISLQQYELLYSNPSQISDPYIAQSARALAGENITLVQVVPRYGFLDPRSEALVQAIRNTSPPGGMHVLVDGSTAGVIDYVNTLYGEFPKALLFVAVITYIALMLLFRSLVLPLKAILMNALSIVAAYGALVFIFQEGHFSNLLNFTPLGFVEASGPILMFCALFGLSMDYEVFLLSRIRESYEQTGDNTRSVAAGVERSGRIITSAAAIVILVSVAFATADMVIIKALGVGMALAVLLDATLVRGLLVPATMRLLGHINWWWPWPFNRLLPPVVFHDAARPRAEVAEDVSHAATGRSLPVGGE